MSRDVTPRRLTHLPPPFQEDIAEMFQEKEQKARELKAAILKVKKSMSSLSSAAGSLETAGKDVASSLRHLVEVEKHDTEFRRACVIFAEITSDINEVMEFFRLQLQKDVVEPLSNFCKYGFKRAKYEYQDLLEMIRRCEIRFKNLQKTRHDSHIKNDIAADLRNLQEKLLEQIAFSYSQFTDLEEMKSFELLRSMISYVGCLAVLYNGGYSVLHKNTNIIEELDKFQKDYTEERLTRRYLKYGYLNFKQNDRFVRCWHVLDEPNFYCYTSTRGCSQIEPIVLQNAECEVLVRGAVMPTSSFTVYETKGYAPGNIICQAKDDIERDEWLQQINSSLKKFKTIDLVKYRNALKVIHFNAACNEYVSFRNEKEKLRLEGEESKETRQTINIGDSEGTKPE